MADKENTIRLPNDTKTLNLRKPKSVQLCVFARLSHGAAIAHASAERVSGWIDPELEFPG